jgi:hypothetical protein
VGDSQGGLSLLKQALALSPGNPKIQHAVELYDARAGDRASLQVLLSRMSSGESGTEELLGIAEIETHAGKPDVAAEALSRLPSSLSSTEALRAALIRSAILAQEGALLKAAALCEKSSSGLGKEDAARLKIQAALYDLAAGTEEDASAGKRGTALLMNVVRGHTDAALSAWRRLCQLALHPPGDARLIDPEMCQELIADYPNLKGRVLSDELLAAELKIHADPSCKEAVVRELTRRHGDSSRSQMLEYARWLNANGLQRQALELAGADKFTTDTDWLLVALDAKCGLGEWKEIPLMLKSPAGSGLPDAVRHLFLARVASITGDRATAEDEWRAVSGGLSLEKPETLAYIAGYEEQIGALQDAAYAYREMSARKECKTTGLIGLIRCQPRTVAASTLIPMYQELTLALPDYADAQSDLVYLKLLGGSDLSEASETAERLLASQPLSLARISTAALGRLRNGHPREAWDLYKGKVIDWKTAPEPWKAVYLAVIRANGDPSGEEKNLPAVNGAQLRPEERELIKPPPPPSKLLGE